MCDRFVQTPIRGADSLDSPAGRRRNARPSYLIEAKGCRYSGCHLVVGERGDGKKDPWFTHAATPSWATGLWEDASKLLPEGNLGTFTVITGESSGQSADIHDRIPVWLAPGQVDALLKADMPMTPMAMLLVSEPLAMEAYRVSRAVNTHRNSTEELFRPVG